MGYRNFSEKIVEWYIDHKRDLPWRNTRDPYKIWLSEVILQQTRVIQGMPYYLRFIERFPDVNSLASASEQEILRLWQGLGYYSRARNLHKCAKVVVESHKGTFPQKFDDLVKLPGVGDYTAAAIASFSSKEVVPVVDGNVFRVLARIFGETTAINTPAGKKVFTSLASGLITQHEPDLFNQGLMEFGATWCTPRQPKCEDCIFSPGCVANKSNLQDALPVKIKNKKPKNRYFYYFVIQKGKSLLMRKRKLKDIWQGLYDFYLIEKSHAHNPEELTREIPFFKALGKKPIMQTTDQYKHVLSHQTIFSTFTIIKSDFAAPVVEEEMFEYFSPKKIHELPKPVLISRFLEDYDYL